MATDRQLAERVPDSIVATAEAIFGDGGIYVASLPRPGDVPAGWQMDRAPRFQPRDPQPGETYQFACEALPARSTGVATVGYRSLEGLPAISVEYVIYPSANTAALALSDMRRAAETCGEFEVSVTGGLGAVRARMTPIRYPAFGNDSFAVALETNSEATGPLLTHVIKIRQDNVVIGINHAVGADSQPPDAAVSESISSLSVAYLDQIR